MRFALAIVIAACSASDGTVESAAAPFVSATDDAAAVRRLTGKPPVIIVVDDRDKTYFAWGESWEHLDVGRTADGTARDLDSIVLDLQNGTHRVSQSRPYIGNVLDDVTPKRQARYVGYVVDAMAIPQRAIVIASPRARAATLVEVVGLTSSAIAVMHRGKLHVLRVDFTPNAAIESAASSWREVHVKPDGIGTHVIGDPFENGPTDLLVDPEATAQDLVDAIVAKHAGVRVLGFGHRPEPKELARRERTAPVVGLGPASVMGLPEAEVRSVIERNRPKLLACYEHLLAIDRRAKVDTEASFPIDSDGVPGPARLTAPASMLDCLRRVIDWLRFPRPQERAEVTYRFTMRP